MNIHTQNRPEWKYHLNTEYIYIDFSGLNSDKDILNQIEMAVAMGLERPDKSVRALVHFKGARTNPGTTRQMAILGKMVQPKIKKSVLVGSSDFLSLLVKVYTSQTGSKIKFFTDMSVALEYLTSN
ncbi:hypothetical protein [Pseudotamlana carrageenivorans]|uniref:STAS/SEC14 domain-containing protein n=1 Tax=Pseudotamlana carrageenivorans TaxID=2069432 RepID=A0A2I7SJB3_9FLAO|nr:hypothetical protein [Tamlana carrageenivorans]AUS05995.1 hypothetical protein C1A40_11270 [Tamlana carrageenivorans]